MTDSTGPHDDGVVTPIDASHIPTSRINSGPGTAEPVELNPFQPFMGIPVNVTFVAATDTMRYDAAKLVLAVGNFMVLQLADGRPAMILIPSIISIEASSIIPVAGTQRIGDN